MLILIVLAGVCVMLLRRGAEDSTGSSDQNLRRAGNNAARTDPAVKSPKQPHVATITPLVSPVSGKVKLPELTDEQVARFLADSHRNPEALLAVFRIKEDLSLLREAAESFPDHAMVQLELAMRGETSEEKQKALESFRKLEPNNALGDCLAALFHFERGQPEEALEELAGAESHPGFGARSPVQIQTAEDLFRTAGYGLLEAKAAALLGQPRTLTIALSKLSGRLAGLHREYTMAGDGESAQAVLQTGLSLSRRLRGEARLLLDDIVGIAMETRFLKQLPEDATMPGSGQTVADRLKALDTERLEILELAKQSLLVLDDMSESEVLSYLKHLDQDGELKALHWLEQNR